MKTYTKEQILKAAELGEVSMIDANHIVSLLEEVEDSHNPDWGRVFRSEPKEEVKPTKADIESFDKSMFSFNSPSQSKGQGIDAEKRIVGVNYFAEDLIAEEILELLNKYTTTSLSWMKDNRQSFCIDPMDYHKIAEEYISYIVNSKIPTDEDILLKFAEFKDVMKQTYDLTNNKMVVTKFLNPYNDGKTKE